MSNRQIYVSPFCAPSATPVFAMICFMFAGCGVQDSKKSNPPPGLDRFVELARQEQENARKQAQEATQHSEQITRMSSELLKNHPAIWGFRAQR